MCLFTSMLLLQSSAYISVNFDPEDLNRISDFFETIMFNRNPLSALEPPISLARRRCCRFLSWFTARFIDACSLGGILLATNLLTEKLKTKDQPIPIPIKVEVQLPESLFAAFQNKQQQQSPNVEPSNSSISSLIKQHGHLCGIDFGCKNGLCWRGCSVSVATNRKLWCYTGLDPQARKYRKCVTNMDCSLCLECIESCHE